MSKQLYLTWKQIMIDTLYIYILSHINSNWTTNVFLVTASVAGCIVFKTSQLGIHRMPGPGLQTHLVSMNTCLHMHVSVYLQTCSNMYMYIYNYIHIHIPCMYLICYADRWYLYHHTDMCIYIYIHIYFAFICNIPPMTCIFPSADLPTLGTMYLYIVVRQHHPSGPDSWQMPYRVGTINPAGRLTGCHIELGATVSADIDTARTPRIEPTGIAMTPLRKERCREK